MLRSPCSLKSCRHFTLSMSRDYTYSIYSTDRAFCFWNIFKANLQGRTMSSLSSTLKWVCPRLRPFHWIWKTCGTKHEKSEICWQFRSGMIGSGSQWFSFGGLRCWRKSTALKDWRKKELELGCPSCWIGFQEIFQDPPIVDGENHVKTCRFSLKLWRWLLKGKLTLETLVKFPRVSCFCPFHSGSIQGHRNQGQKDEQRSRVVFCFFPGVQTRSNHANPCPKQHEDLRGSARPFQS